MRRNWIIKLGLLSLEYDLKQIHMSRLVDDDGDGPGDYNLHDLNITNITTIFNKVKTSSIGRIILNKINLGKFIFDEKRSNEFKESLKSFHQNIYGIVLKRKFPKEENEDYYFHFIYSVWLYCESEGEDENQGIQTKTNIPFNPLMIDWEGKKKNITNDTDIKINSTPIFLLGNIDNEIDENPNENEDQSNDKDSKDNSYEFNILQLFIKMGGFFLFIIIVIIIIIIFIKVKKKKILNNNIKIEFTDDDNGGLLIKADD